MFDQPAHPDQLAVRGHLRTREWHRVTHGIHRTSAARDLDAWQLALHPSGRFTHLTAAAAYGWWLPPLPEGLPVICANWPVATPPQRSGFLVRRTEPVGEGPVMRNGLRLDAPVDVLINLARDLQLLDTVVVLDAALHMEDCTLDEVRAASRHRRRGAPMLRRALRLCDGRSESLYESLLRVLHVVGGFAVDPQHIVKDANDEFVGRLDLLLVGTNLGPEYDGAHHLPVEQQRDDLDRIRRLRHAGVERQGWTSAEVLRQPRTILADAERATGRPMRLDAVTRWSALLRDSCMTAAGRHRLAKRLIAPNDREKP